MAKKIRFLAARVILIWLGFVLPGTPDYDDIEEVGSGSTGSGGGGVEGCIPIAALIAVLVAMLLAFAYCQYMQ